MTPNELPPLPNKEKLHTVLPDDYRYGHIYGYTADQMREYARAAYERAASLCDNADKSAHPADLADAIRALGRRHD